MASPDPRIDAYIQKSAPFAQPILLHLRALIHEAAPEIQETMKWSFPHFDYKGTVCSMAAFKQHCSYGFWKSRIMPDPFNLLKEQADTAAGQFGRITSLADLPSREILMLYIKNAVELNEAGVKMGITRPKKPAVNLAVPDDFIELLDQSPIAKEYFGQLSNSHRKEYIQWITEAKTEVTRQKRMLTAIEMISDGKSRHWKYQR